MHEYEAKLKTVYGAESMNNLKVSGTIRSSAHNLKQLIRGSGVCLYHCPTTENILKAA